MISWYYRSGSDAIPAINGQPTLASARPLQARNSTSPTKKSSCLPALSLTHGKTVFSQNCATCHRLGGIGQVIGPNRLSVAGWTPEQVLVAVMNSNRAVEPRYLSFTATLYDGQTLFGIISAEYPASITIEGLDGKETAGLRGGLRTRPAVPARRGDRHPFHRTQPALMLLNGLSRARTPGYNQGIAL
jgi:putative heme-binding domain-containing protein